MDLNIDNYTYSDLLNVFKISNNNSLENIDKMNKLFKEIQNNYPKEIVKFFSNSRFALSFCTKPNQFHTLSRSITKSVFELYLK